MAGQNYESNYNLNVSISKDVLYFWFYLKQEGRLDTDLDFLNVFNSEYWKFDPDNYLYEIGLSGDAVYSGCKLLILCMIANYIEGCNDFFYFSRGDMKFNDYFSIIFQMYDEFLKHKQCDELYEATDAEYFRFMDLMKMSESKGNRF